MNISKNIFNALVIKNPAEIYQITKAKKLYLINHLECALCGTIKKLEVHHIIPVHIDLNMACNPINFVTLCDNLFNDGCHNRFGHFGNFKTCYNKQIRELIMFSRILNKTNTKFTENMTQLLLEEFAIALNIPKNELINQVFGKVLVNI